jgi:hypothetical protein
LVAVKLVVFFVLLGLCTSAEEKWVRMRSGPFEVLSNAGERPARERLYEAEQFRWMTGQLLGKEDPGTVWPIRIVVLKSKRSAPLAMGRDSWISTDIDDAWRSACARILIDDNTGRLPPEIERGLIALLSRLRVSGPKLTLGTPPPERSRDWARVRLLATTPDYIGRFHVFISNLEQSADYDVAYRNAFQKRQADIEKEVDAAMASGNVEPASVSGRALSEKDFTAREATPHDGAIALADLLGSQPATQSEAQALYRKAGGVEADEGLKQWDAATKAGSTNARAWFGLGTREGYLKAAELNPRWAEPHVKLAAFEQDPGRKATELQKAAKLEPRNAATWKALALALIDARQYVLAAKAWAGAERASPTPEERATMHQARLDLETARADYEESERKKRLAEEARDLQRVKNSALREIREAEAKANQQLQKEHGAKPDAVIKMEDLDKTNKVTGRLERVDCLKNGEARLNVRSDADHKLLQFTIADPKSIAISGGANKALGCGPQHPARAIAIEFRSARDVQTIEFP